MRLTIETAIGKMLNVKIFLSFVLTAIRLSLILKGRDLFHCDMAYLRIFGSILALKRLFVRITG